MIQKGLMIQLENKYPHIIVPKQQLLEWKEERK